jgi:hypothetical protein
MKQYVLKFLHRGLMFGGFGPIILGIIYYMLSLTITDFSLSGDEIAIAIGSIYLLAFIHAGASVFNQIEEWPIAKSLLIHFATLYIAYVGCYLLNSWIPFDVKVILIFTAIFAVSYLVIWLSVFFAVRGTSRRLNEKVK